MSSAQLNTEQYAFLTSAYTAARQAAGVQGNIVVLHVGAEQTAVAVGDGPQLQAVRVLPIGAERTAREHFRTAPPTALAGVSGSAPLSLEAMERCFNDLTAVVMGAPAARLGLPQTHAFAATLLILREFMHHMQFAQLEVLNP